MLTFLKIKNLALIESAEIEFSPGFNVLTGESGAGKSILMGALGLLLGDRPDKNLIRTGEKSCEVSCLLLPEGETVRHKLEVLLHENGVDFSGGGELLIRRSITASGTRNYLNDCSVSVKTLTDAATLLIDLHHPDDQLSLHSRVRQLELLDRYGMLSRDPCREAAAKVRAAEERLNAFLSERPDQAAYDEALEAIAEIDRVHPEPGEDEALQERHKLLSNGHEIIELANMLTGLLTDGEESLIDRIATVNRELVQLSRLAPEAGEEFVADGDLLSEGVRNLSMKLEQFVSSMDLDEESFAKIEERLSELHKLKRRYGPSLEMVLNYWKEARNLVERHQSGENIRRELEKERTDRAAELDHAARILSLQRREHGSLLVAAILEKLAEIGFKNCRMDWQYSLKDSPDETGIDIAELLFSANPGEDLRPLRQIASSGERSRLFLALKSVLAEVDDIPVVVFDEIDANIGGETANKVAATLEKLGESRQIISISHLAQVAARAGTHFKIVKTTEDGRTRTRVFPLSSSDRIDEIARMLGNTPAARIHAEELLPHTDLQ